MSKPVKVKVGLATCGIAAGAQKVYDVLEEQMAGLPVELDVAGCMGMCYNEPLVEVIEEDGTSYIYGNVNTENVLEIVDKHLKQGQVVPELVVYSKAMETADNAFIDKQERLLLKNCGVINPESIDSYISVGGYEALTKALKTMNPEDVIKEIMDSGLRGRGGAGFSTGLKWSFNRKSQSDRKYVVCNADEGDPGAFMDRSVLESTTHAVLEGMLIAGYAQGAQEGYVYIRAEYPLAIKRLKIAIEQAEKAGYLGDNILGTDFSFRIKIREGAGAFVCGEETALIMSIEGKRGMPRIRPPFPTDAGIWGKPTAINNVETFANVPFIIKNGASAFNKFGNETCKGTKVFALAGKVVRGGLIEVPMGMTIREIVFDIAGGLPDGGKLKAVQTGGPSGGCIPASLADTPVDYDSLKKIGAIMGSGGMLVMDESNCMVDVAKFFLNFTQDESCGKCTYCRIGTKRMQEILTRITNGEGKEGDIELLEDLGHKIIAGSLCALGQSAPNPVLTTIKYFREEYEAHIRDKKCPAKKCKALIHYEVDTDNCKGCGRCNKNCPTGAVHGEKKQPYVLDQDKCIKCGLCESSCKFGGIMVIAGSGKEGSEGRVAANG